MVDLIPAAAVLLRTDGTIADSNDLAARLLNGRRDELNGSSLLAHIDPASHSALQSHLSIGEPEQTEIKLKDSDRWLLLRSMPSERGRCAILFEITPHVACRSELENARASAKSKTEFLARLSHEIRSALASMIGFSDMLSENVSGSNRELADVITRSGRHILDTLNSVMDLARLEFSRDDLTLEEVDLVEHVKDRVLMFRPRLRDKRVTLSFYSEQASVPALANPIFLDRIVHNLIDNAIKYTPEGEVVVVVTNREGHPAIRVTDTGLGIDEKFMPRLFLPFEREKQTAAAAEEGAGLGLAITKYLVELMDGRIYARSRKGKGSTFTITLPSPGREPQAAEG